MSTAIRRTVPAIALAGAMAMLATGCIAGENAGNTTDSAAATGEWSTDQLTLDWATYNPLSLVLRDQGLIEDALGDDVTVEWVQSTGSNTANERLGRHRVDGGIGRIPRPRQRLADQGDRHLLAAGMVGHRRRRRQ